MNKYNELYPSNWTNAAHTLNGKVTTSNQLFYVNQWKTTDQWTSQYIFVSGSGQFDYTSPLPKGVRYVDVSISMVLSCAGSSTYRTFVTDSSGNEVASGTSSVNLSAYANSKEDLYLHIYAAAGCGENVGYGGVATRASVDSISLRY